MFVCVDKDAQALPGLGADNDGVRMYHTSVSCKMAYHASFCAHQGFSLCGVH